MPPLTLDGTTGVSAVQAGSIQSDDLAAGVGGKVLQVVQSTTNTVTTINSSSFQDTGLSVSITPSSTSSKILIITTQVGDVNNPTGRGVQSRLLRNGSQIFFQQPFISIGDSGNYFASAGLSYLDNPTTSSSVSYKIQARAKDPGGNTASLTFQRDFDGLNSNSTIVAMEIAG